MSEPSGGDLDRVRQGLRMATPPDPQKLQAEREQLRELEHAPLLQRWGGYLRFIGPGYLQSAMTLGSGTAASSLFAGAVFGYELLWVAPVGMLIGILVMGVVSHQTLSTGERVLPAMARHTHPVIAGGFALAAMVASIVWHFPQYNLAAASLVDAADAVGAEGVPTMGASAFVLVWAVLLSTMYGKSPRLVRVYERLLKYTVWGIVVMLLWVLLNTETDWAGVAAGFVPSLPEDRGEFRSLDLAVAGIAAAVGINML
ncbi:MAG: divalent metal cation transporter, partial [Planctomycetes bacterium]|nr:divalent metal cation transporter [Planctomycetota bacterium]